jgi:hypothetical protein
MKFIKNMTLFEIWQTSISTATLFVLTLTLLFLSITTSDTRRIANQTVESAIRPVILRSGQIVGWNIVSLEDIGIKNLSPTLEFTNQRNIATDITGYVILSNKKYPLVFRGDVRGSVIVTSGHKTVVYNDKWSWLPEGGILEATYKSKEFSETKEKNQIHLSYKDLEGNKYFTNEDYLFSPSSGKE